MFMKVGRTDLLAQPRHGPQAGKFGDPRSQNADTIVLAKQSPKRNVGADELVVCLYLSLVDQPIALLKL